MALNLNLAGPVPEWSVVGNTEAVTLYRRQSDGTFDGGTAVANAFRMAAGKDVDAGPGQGVLARTKLSWLVWARQTGCPNPKAGDVLQDGGGTRWTVWRVDVQAWGQRFGLDTVQER